MANNHAIKMRVRDLGDNTAELMVLVKHPMETGLRKDKVTKKVIPAHFIQKMNVIHNGKEIADADLGIAVAKNPIMGFGLKNAKTGDKVKVSWSDNKGESGSAEKTIEL
ncbi:MAG: thiosulfate oxidation carrier complex protein SoxZ [Acidiferrobacteraceae bacterium]|jgi:sulfur-oxidizing protein SoxZ